MTETRWRDIAMALINRTRGQQVTVTLEELEKAQGWIVLNGKHFCCAECKAMVETYES